MYDKDDDDYLQALISRMFPIFPINSWLGSYSTVSHSKSIQKFNKNEFRNGIIQYVRKNLRMDFHPSVHPSWRFELRIRQPEFMSHYFRSKVQVLRSTWISLIKLSGLISYLACRPGAIRTEFFVRRNRALRPRLGEPIMIYFAFQYENNIHIQIISGYSFVQLPFAQFDGRFECTINPTKGLV